MPVYGTGVGGSRRSVGGYHNGEFSAIATAMRSAAGGASSGRTTTVAPGAATVCHTPGAPSSRCGRYRKPAANGEWANQPNRRLGWSRVNARTVRFSGVSATPADSTSMAYRLARPSKSQTNSASCQPYWGNAGRSSRTERDSYGLRSIRAPSGASAVQVTPTSSPSSGTATATAGRPVPTSYGTGCSRPPEVYRTWPVTLARLSSSGVASTVTNPTGKSSGDSRSGEPLCRVARPVTSRTPSSSARTAYVVTS